MITILNGKLTIPESERFIGFAGDNLARTIEFLLSGRKEADRIYRLYLTFDDGTVNFFVLPGKVVEDGVLLTWKVKKEHIFKGGNVRVQIKAFSNAGVVYHTTPDTIIVGNSAEFSDSLSIKNAEFLEYEEMLNNLKAQVSDIATMTPYIGDNGNWYIYDADKGEYIDSSRPACAEVQDITVDQTYNSKSENPQSGKAVAQALSQFDASTGSAWQRKQVSADCWPDMDMLIINGSSNYDMYVLTLGPDLFEDGMSYEPLIAFIDGKGNKNMLMMDMGNGSWWEYKCDSNNITRVNGYSSTGGDKDFIFVSYREGIDDVVSVVTDNRKLYLVHMDIGTINGIYVPMGYYLTKIIDSSELKFTTAIPDGTVYTYDIENKTLTVEKSGAGTEVVVDQAYSPTSSHAQSGKAVAQALAEFDASGGNCWQRKHISADCWPDMDMLILRGSSNYDMYVLTLGPDLFDEDMSFEPLIAFIDGKGNDNMIMMDMGNGSWWEYEYGSNRIIRVKNPSESYIYAGFFASIKGLANYSFKDDYLYTFFYDGDDKIPGTNYHGRYFEYDNARYLVFSKSIPDGKIYTLNLTTQEVTIDNLKGVIDQTYSPTSSHAQSGKAVAQALAEFDASGGNSWQRKYVSADCWPDMDMLIINGSSNYDMYVLTLGPDLFEDGMSYEPLIAFIDGKGNKNMLMMDMGNGSWWEYKCDSNNITRVNVSCSDTGDKDFIFVSYREGIDDVVSVVTDNRKIYLVHMDIGTINGIYVPMGYYLTKIIDSSELKFTTAIPDGTVYTYDIENKTLTVESCGSSDSDFEYIGYCATIDIVAQKTTDTSKLYMGNFDIDSLSGISVPYGHNLIQRKNANTIKFTTAIPNGTVYTYDISKKELTVQCAQTSIKDEGEYFVSETVEGALQELGAELSGVASLLSQI